MIQVIEKSTTLGIIGDDSDVRSLVDAFAFDHPQKHMIDTYRMYRITGGEKGWDGKLRPFKRTGDGTGAIPRGFRDDVLKACKQLDIHVDTSKLLTRPFASLTPEDIPDDILTSTFKLDYGQRSAVATWLVNGIGVCHATVSSGKTAMLAAAAAMIKRSHPDAQFLYITPSERLVSQTYKEMKKFLPGWDVGKFGGGGPHHKDAKDMVVCTLAMLNRNFRKLTMEKWWKRFICILFDESHHASCASASKVLNMIPAYFRLGASDSMKAGDPIKESTIKGLLGPIRFHIDAKPLIQVGRLAQPWIYVVDNLEWNNTHKGLGHRADIGSQAWVQLAGIPDPISGIYRGNVYNRTEAGDLKTAKRKILGTNVDTGAPEFQDVEEPIIIPGFHVIEIDGAEYQVESKWCLIQRTYDQAIINFQPRNDLVCEWAKYFSDQGKQTLIVATRTWHTRILETMMSKVVDPKLVRVLTSENTMREKDDTFDWVRKTPGCVLVSSLVKEGVSINELRAGIIADVVADHEVGNQVLGRFMRRKEVDNYAEIVWFFDRQNASLRKACQRFFRGINQIKGYFFVYPVVHPQDVVSARTYDTTSIIEGHRA